MIEFDEIILDSQRRKGGDDFLRDEDDLRVGDEIARGFGDDVEGALDQLARMDVGDAPRVINAIDGVSLQPRDPVTRHVARKGQPEVVRQSRNRTVAVDNLDGLRIFPVSFTFNLYFRFDFRNWVRNDPGWAVRWGAQFTAQ